MANLASHMTPRMDDAPAFTYRTGQAEEHEEPAIEEVSGVSTKIYHYLGVDTPFDPQHRLVTSYILPVPALALFRVVVAIYMLVTAFSTAVVEGIGTITYFTSLSFWGDTTYFLMSAIHTCTFWFALSRWKKASREQGSSRIEMVEKAFPHNGVGRIEIARHKAGIDAFGTQLHEDIESELAYGKDSEFEIGSRYPRSLLSRKFSRPLQVCHTLLVSTVSSFPLVVLVIFWSLLAGPAPLGDPYSAFANIGKHTLNYVLTMIDLVILSRTPLRPWWHLVPVMAFLALYIGIVSITYNRYHVWVYGFFNVQQFGLPLVVCFTLLLACFAVASFCLTQGLMLLREYVAAKVQSSGQWGSAKAVGVPDDACIPTLRGPGPLGGGGRRTKPGHDVIHLRGRFPSNALNTRRSSGIIVDDIHIQALSGLGSEQNVDDAAVKFGSNRAQRPSIRFADESPMEEYRSPSRSDLPNPDASSSQAQLFRPIGW
ncbi:hypothetical protein PHSY_005298 [Pseudozyma hubeiensis SY62]|uniref:Uncharacterized protein n=1 Tax=Pseudozyma hubeiensis (strain SY62) TaxID=1305764 RepID=R9P8M4_PSEHS|nr:hypothetical protein PHSY_005298 [Pseudozyma hubeiensis SY62]GAC97711.1 hypothetical protein PHSY_005298 [Pseudozyma hubeiensis SY62]